MIQELPPEYRIVLVLRGMEGLTDEEVGDITGLRPANVRVRLHRARLFVRKKLARYGQKARAAKKTDTAARGVEAETATQQKWPASCKVLFAQLSDYLDEQLGDSLCENWKSTWKGASRAKLFWLVWKPP